MVVFYKEMEFRDTKLGKIPKEWEIKEIKDVCKVVTGGTPSTKHPEYFGGNIKWLKSGDIKEPYIYDTEEKITQLGIENSNAKIHPAGSVAIALSGRGQTRGRTAIIKEPMACSQSVAFMIPNSKLIAEFLHYNLSNRYLEIRNLTGHYDRSGLNLSIVSNIKIPIPPYFEQQKIGEILSTVDEAIQKTDEVIAKTERLKKGLMQELLTKGIGHKEFKDTEIGRIPTEWEVVKLGNENLFEIYCDSPLKIAEEDDVLVSVRAPVGELNIANHRCCIGRGIAGIRSKTSDSSFLFYSLNHLKNSWIKERTTFEEIKTSHIKNKLLVWPRHEERRKIIEILSTLDKKLQIERNEKTKLERIKQGLMDLLLTGKIRVKAE